MAKVKKPRQPVRAIKQFPPDTDPDGQLAWLCEEIRGNGGKFTSTALAKMLVAHAERLRGERDAFKETQGE